VPGVTHLCYTPDMTTTIRIDKELRNRIAAAAEREGKSAHAFMLDAIANTVGEHEADAAFHELAVARLAQMERTGRSIAWSDTRQWLKARAKGKSAQPPAARKKRG